MDTHSPRSKFTLTILLGSITLIASLGIIAYVVMAPGPEPPPPPEPPQPITTVVEPEIPSFDAEAFFDSDVKPIIAKTDKAHREAVQRCLSRLEDSFAKYRRGIPHFVDDLSSYRTRFGIMSLMPSDWWNESDDIGVYIGEKFEKHMFSEKRLERDIDNALQAFKKDIEANRNEMLIQIRATVEASDLPHIPKLDSAGYAKDLKQRLKEFAAESGKDSVKNMLIVEIASGVLGVATKTLITSISIRLAASVTGAAAGAGGATAGGTAAGGTGGSVAGPPGAFAGAAVGFLLGIIIDWYMTDQFQKKLSHQLDKMITDASQTVVSGTKSTAGLREMLTHTCDQFKQAYRDLLREQIVGEAL